MKPETEQFLEDEYYNRFIKQEGVRFVIYKRRNFNEDQIQLRIIEVRLARSLGLIGQLDPRQQEVLNLLYPDSLELPRKSEIANVLNVSWQTVDKFENAGINRLGKMFEKGLISTRK